MSMADLDNLRARVARIMERLDGRLPPGYSLSQPYPKVGHRDTIVAERPEPERSGAERVYRNRTGSRFVYIHSHYGFIFKAGVTSSRRVGERWATAVRRKARIARATRWLKES